jgi:DNA replication licensing factor MCM7
VANRENLQIEIELEDLKEFFDSARDHGFVERIKTNTSRYMSIFSDIIDKHMPQPSREFTDDEHSSFDIVMQ